MAQRSRVKTRGSVSSMASEEFNQPSPIVWEDEPTMPGVDFGKLVTLIYGPKKISIVHLTN